MTAVYFRPNGYVGQRDDDDTPRGLARRLVEAGHSPVVEGEIVRVNVHPDAGDASSWITKMEAHFGCEIVDPTDEL